MTGQETSLLRTAGLPIRLWCAGGSPQLFDLIRELARAENEFAQLGVSLAEAIGTELVPVPELSAQERRQVLAWRRRLHHGSPLSTADHRRLTELAIRVVPHSDLLADLTRATDWRDRLAGLYKEVGTRHEAERKRLTVTGYELLLGSPVGQLALLDGTLPAGTELGNRLATGQSWTDKQVRKRADYLWRMIARGAAKVTPRGWLGHVALISVADAAATPLALTTEVCTHWIENVHIGPTVAATPEGLGFGTRVSLAALTRVDKVHLHVLTLSEGDVDGIVATPVTVRRTPLMNKLYSALRHGALFLAELEKAILPPNADQKQQLVLRQFLIQLRDMGVLQLREPARQRHRSWEPAGPAPSGRQVDHVEHGYLDVYRRTTGAILSADQEILRSAITQALRLQHLMTTDMGPQHVGVLELLDEQERSVLDVVRDLLAERGRTPELFQAKRIAGWPEASTPDSGYAGLLDWLRGRAAGHTPIDLTSELLNRFDAPHTKPLWPLDCIVRPLPGRRWVLDTVAPTGVLDARFVTELERLHGSLPHVLAYRDFLRRLDADTGVPSVELLFPALSRYAANAVRRPLYANRWTGDPDLLAYCDGANHTHPRFLPLAELTARRTGGDVVVSADGGPIRPLYHSARSAPPPWDLVAAVLMRASPQAMAWRRRLRHTLTALPDLDFVPRVTVAGAVVISAAQWRVPSDALPAANASELDRVRQLARLRDDYGLPRWVFVSAGPGTSSPRACDLDSLYTIRTLERAAASATSGVVVIEEMVPSPSELTISDLAEPGGAVVAAELMVRLPVS